MDSDLKAGDEVVVNTISEVTEVVTEEVGVESNAAAEDVVMNSELKEPEVEEQTNEDILNASEDQNDSAVDPQLTTEDITTNTQTEDQLKDEQQSEEVVIIDNAINFEANEEVIDLSEDVIEVSQEGMESQNSSAMDSQRMSTDEDMTPEIVIIKNQSTSDSPQEVENQLNESTLPAVDEDMSDSKLRIAGLKTSLMLSEEKNQRIDREKKELEGELKKVYQHLFKCLDEKKGLQKKCETLEEQLDKLMTTSGHKRPAQESPGTQSVVPKKAPNNGYRKSVRFHEQRPAFGRFGARFQEDDDMTPPPFPGQYAPAFIPPQMAQQSRGYPMDGYRVSSSMAGPDMSDFAQRDAFELISKIGNRLQLSAKIVDRAVRLFRQCYESPLRAMCRTQNQSTATACVYVACREEHCPQTFKALTSVSKVDYKVMGQCCQYIVNALGVGWDEMTPEEAVQEFCLRSGFSPMIEMAAQQIARKAIQMKLIPGNNALTCAAAAVYLASIASDDQRPVFEFATLTGVGDTTIRSSYNRIVSYARQLFPQSFPFFVPPEHLPLL